MPIKFCKDPKNSHHFHSASAGLKVEVRKKVWNRINVNLRVAFEQLYGNFKCECGLEFGLEV